MEARNLFFILCHLLIASKAAGSRAVSWYMPARPAADTLSWLQTNPASYTGVYLCCNSYTFLANGSFTGISADTAKSQSGLLLQNGLSVHYVIGIAQNSVQTRSWRHGIADAVQAAVDGGFNGFIVDYEPDTNYTWQHEEAYGEFLSALSTALHGVGKQSGFCSAGWGILSNWTVYSKTGVDIATSMQPTYSYIGDGSKFKAFVTGELSGGMSPSVIGSGIGTMLTPANKKSEEWHYNWTQTELSGMASWLVQAGVQRMDFWRADIDHHLDASATEPWVFQAAQAFLAAH